MKELTQNERVPVGGLERQAVVVDASWSASGTPTGIYVFLLDADARIPSRHHVIFGGSTTAPDGSTLLKEDIRSDLARAQIQVHLTGTDPALHGLRFILAVSQVNATLAHVAEVTTSVWDPCTGEVHGTYALSPDGMNKCLILGDLRRVANGWEFEAKGAEFAGSIVDMANQVGAAS